MPNELKMWSDFSTSNLAHPADHYTPLHTDPLPAELKGNGRIAGSYVSLKRQEPIRISQSQSSSPLCADIDVPSRSAWREPQIITERLGVFFMFKKSGWSKCAHESENHNCKNFTFAVLWVCYLENNFIFYRQSEAGNKSIDTNSMPEVISDLSYKIKNMLESCPQVAS